MIEIENKMGGGTAWGWSPVLQSGKQQSSILWLSTNGVSEWLSSAGSYPVALTVQICYTSLYIGQ